MTAVNPAAMAAVIPRALTSPGRSADNEALAVPATTPIDPDRRDRTVEVRRYRDAPLRRSVSRSRQRSAESFIDRPILRSDPASLKKVLVDSPGTAGRVAAHPANGPSATMKTTALICDGPFADARVDVVEPSVPEARGVPAPSLLDGRSGRARHAPVPAIGATLSPNVRQGGEGTAQRGRGSRWHTACYVSRVERNGGSCCGLWLCFSWFFGHWVS